MKIFLSYRRDDSAGYAGRLADCLAERFGAPHVFRDVDSIPAGANFVKQIEAAVANCDVLVAVIGPEWLGATNAAGQRRLDDPEDFVRLEIAAALDRDIPVIPVLVEGAAMPSPEALPPALAPLSQQNALDLSDSRWDYDMSRLAKAIDPHTDAAPPDRSRRRRWTGFALGALAAVLVLGLTVSLMGEEDGGGRAEPSVRIVEPESLVIDEYPEVVETEADNLPEGKVWFVLQPVGMEHYQPDHPPTRLGENRWRGNVYAGGENEPESRYVLHVVVADDGATQAFTDYLELNKVTNDYKGFPRLPEGARVIESFVVTRR